MPSPTVFSAGGAPTRTCSAVRTDEVGGLLPSRLRRTVRPELPPAAGIPRLCCPPAAPHARTGPDGLGPPQHRPLDAARRCGLVGLAQSQGREGAGLRGGEPGPLLQHPARRSVAGPEAEPAGASSRPRWATGCPGAHLRASRGRRGHAAGAGAHWVRRGAARQLLLRLAAHSYGDMEAARQLARDNLRRIGDVERFDVIVSECGSCSGHLKDYGELLMDDPEWRDKAERLQGKVRSFSELMAATPAFSERLAAHRDAPLAAGRGGANAAGAERRSESGRTVVTYHEPCHLGRRYQDVTEQPRRSSPPCRASSSARRLRPPPAAVLPAATG